MIISEKWGPQFDSQDGTIGELQLVKRFTLMANDRYFFAQQGRFTYETKERAEEIRGQFKEANKNNQYAELVKTLEVVAVWCYPNHFDPVGLVRD